MHDQWHQFRFALAGLALVLVGGWVGYLVIGLGPFEAIYQTAITVTTVGYGEIGIDGVDEDDYRAFTLALVLLGAGTTVYTVTVLIETLVEGNLNDGLRRRRMAKQVDRMDDHIIVVGWGRVGRAIADYARRHGADVVIVDQRDVDTDDLPLVVGDAHEDDTLLEAGVDRAAVLIAALDTDGANLALTLTARSLRDDLFIVARTASQNNERKFVQAGANRVVNPHEIGGSRMGALAMHPTVAEFVDEVLHDERHDVEIVEVPVTAGSPMIGLDLAALLVDGEGAAVLAVRSADGSYLANPPRTTVLADGDVIVALGSSDQVRDLRSGVAARRPVHVRAGPRG